MDYLGNAYAGVAFGAGLCLIGAAYGISRLASAALEGTARQPEAAGPLQTMMIISAGLIEGLGFFALVILLLGTLSLNKGVEASSGEAIVAEEAAH